MGAPRPALSPPPPPPAPSPPAPPPPAFAQHHTHLQHQRPPVHMQNLSTALFMCEELFCNGLGENDYEITVKEAILIKSHKPNMNKQLLVTNGTYFMLKVFLSSILKFFGLCNTYQCQDT